jgi:broad specificity phosphatase PhoE
VLIHLIRHAAAWNTERPEGTPQPVDPGLTPEGVRQAEMLAARLARLPIERLATSAMVRAVETAAILSRAIGRPVEVWSGCHEHRPEPGYRALGGHGLRARFPEVCDVEGVHADGWYYGEEPRAAAVARAEALVARLWSWARARPSGHLALVTHGGFGRYVLARALGLPEELIPRLNFDHTGVTTLEPRRTGFRILAVNETSHLAGTEVDPALGVSR